MKVVTELVLGFPTQFATPQMLAKQQALFDVLHNGLVALPINLPFTGTPLFQSLCQSTRSLVVPLFPCRLVTPLPFTATLLPFTATPLAFIATPLPFTATPLPFTATSLPFTANQVSFMSTPLPFTASQPSLHCHQSSLYGHLSYLQHTSFLPAHFPISCQ